MGSSHFFLEQPSDPRLKEGTWRGQGRERAVPAASQRLRAGGSNLKWPI